MVEGLDKTTAGGPVSSGPTGRRADGTFAPGVSGNLNGNPNNRRAVMLRNALLASVTGEQFGEVAQGLVEAAKGGDSAAANVLFRYTIGEAKDSDAQDEARRALLAAFSVATLSSIARDRGMPDGVR